MTEHPSMVERRLQCEIDGHFTRAGLWVQYDAMDPSADRPWMGEDRWLCLVCGEHQDHE